MRSYALSASERWCQVGVSCVSILFTLIVHLKTSSSSHHVVAPITLLFGAFATFYIVYTTISFIPKLNYLIVDTHALSFRQAGLFREVQWQSVTSIEERQRQGRSRAKVILTMSEDGLERKVYVPDIYDIEFSKLVELLRTTRSAVQDNRA